MSLRGSSDQSDDPWTASPFLPATSLLEALEGMCFAETRRQYNCTYPSPCPILIGRVQRYAKTELRTHERCDFVTFTARVSEPVANTSGDAWDRVRSLMGEGAKLYDACEEFFEGTYKVPSGRKGASRQRANTDGHDAGARVEAIFCLLMRRFAVELAWPTDCRAKASQA